MEALSTLFVAAMLETVADGTVVGQVIVREPKVVRETYEVAAWFRDHTLKPGVYDVVYKKYNGYPHYVLTAEVNTVITDACLVALFGGVQYGPDSAGQREIGKESTYSLTEFLGYSLDPSRRVCTIKGHEFVPYIS